MPEGPHFNTKISTSTEEPTTESSTVTSPTISSAVTAMRKDSISVLSTEVMVCSGREPAATASTNACRRSSVRNDGINRRVSFREKRRRRLASIAAPTTDTIPAGEDEAVMLQQQNELGGASPRSAASVHRAHSHREVRTLVGSSFQFKNNRPKRSTSFRESLRQGENYQVLMLGAVGVGKSSLVRQFQTSNMDHVRIQVSNVYGDNCKNVNEAQLIILDNPAMEITAEMALACCDVDAYVIVYSVTDKDSFQVAKKIVKGISSQENFSKKAAILVGNKVDLVRKRVVSTEEGKTCATTCECKFIETSDWIDYNVDELFEGVLAQIRLRLEAAPSSGGDGSAKGKKRERRGYRRSKTLGAKSWGMLKDFINRINRKVKSCDDLHVL